MFIKGIARTMAVAGCIGWSLTAGAVTTDGNWSDWLAWSGSAPSGVGNNPTAGGNNWNANAPDIFAPGVVYQSVPDGTFPGGGDSHDVLELPRCRDGLWPGTLVASALDWLDTSGDQVLQRLLEEVRVAWAGPPRHTNDVGGAAGVARQRRTR